MKNKRKKILIGAAAIAAIAGVVLVELLRERESIFVGTIEFTKIYVSPRVASQVKKRLVDEGMIVEERRMLYQLACEDIGVYREKLSNDYDRAEKMLKSGTMSPQSYDAVKAQYATNALQWDWCEVRAPIDDAVVLTRFSEPGDWVQPGVTMMTLGDMNDVWAYVYVDQPMIASLPIGMKVTGYLPEIKRKVPGHIIKINDEAEFTPKNAQTRKERIRLVFGVKIKFENPESILKPGMPIEVTFSE